MRSQLKNKRGKHDRTVFDHSNIGLVHYSDPTNFHAGNSLLINSFVIKVILKWLLEKYILLFVIK